MTARVSTFDACVGMYKDPRNVFLVISCLSMIAGRAIDICGKDCSKYANLVQIGRVFGTLFDFWDSGEVVQSFYGGLRDIKIIAWDHYKNGLTVEDIREGQIVEGKRDPKTILSEDITGQTEPYKWMVERVVVAALRTFSKAVVVYAALSRLGAIKQTPSANLKALGAAAGGLTYAIAVNEQERKLQDGPIYSKIGKPAKDPAYAGIRAEYENLYDKHIEYEKYQKMTFIFIKLIFVAAALGPVAEKGSLMSRVSPWTGDALTVGFMTFGVLSLMQRLQSGAEMKEIEKDK